jgi:hypothetical protein
MRAVLGLRQLDVRRVVRTVGCADSVERNGPEQQDCYRKQRQNGDKASKALHHHDPR